MTYNEHLIEIMMEECAEVIQRCSKAKRFGLFEVQIGQNLNNSERIRSELHDLMAVIEMCVSAEILEYPNDRKVIEMKKEKVLDYLEYCRKIGTLDV